MFLYSFLILSSCNVYKKLLQKLYIGLDQQACKNFFLVETLVFFYLSDNLRFFVY